MSQTMPPLHRGVGYAVSVVAVALLLTGGAVGLPAQALGHADDRRTNRKYRASSADDRHAPREQQFAPPAERTGNRTYEVTNVTVSDRTPVVDQQTAVRVTVWNAAAEDRTVHLDIYLGDRLLVERSVTLPANDTRTFTFEITPRQPGTRALTVDGKPAGSLDVGPQPSSGEFALLFIAVGAALLALVTASLTAAYFERT